MNAGQLFSLGFLWMAAAGIASDLAGKNGWSEWRWFLAAIALGPLAWMALIVRLRDLKEKVGHRGPSHRRARPKPTTRIIR